MLRKLTYRPPRWSPGSCPIPPGAAGMGRRWWIPKGLIAAVAFAQGLVFLSLKSMGSLPRGNTDRDYRLRSHWSKLPPVRSATRAQRKEQNQQLLGRCTKDGNSNTASLYKESETKMLLSVFVGLTTDLAFLQKTS